MTATEGVTKFKNNNILFSLFPTLGTSAFDAGGRVSRRSEVRIVSEGAVVVRRSVVVLAQTAAPHLLLGGGKVIEVV